MTNFNDRSRQKTAEGKNEKINTYKSAYAPYEGRELIINAFRSGIFPIKTQGRGLRILIPKQMLQRLPIAVVQVKAGATSGNLLSEIRQIIYCLYRAKGITEKVYNNIINFIKF